MTKKEAIVKYITEMNTDMLSLILDDNKSYMDVPKETFIEKLKETFEKLQNQDIKKFSRVLKGHCGGDCNNGCGGYTFLTNDNRSLDLIFEEENDDIKDLYTCTIFNIEEPIENRTEIYMSFYDDEKSNYIPTSKHLVLQKKIETAFSEFHKFRNDITDIETFCNWNIHIVNLYDSISLLERFSLKFTNTILDLVCKNSNIQKLITFYPVAKKAMNEFKRLDISNETELIQWVLKYEDNELFYSGYEKVNNWEQNNLMLHSLDKSIVLDGTKYAESLYFSEIHPKYYWELFEKYKITPEQFNEAKAQTKDLQYNLMTFLKILGKHQQLDIFKTENKPIYLKYVIGKPEPTDQFIVIAGKELGINVKPEQIGTAYTFKDDNGITQIESSPKQIRNEIENKKADKFYSQEIGPDWKNIFQNKIIELFNNNQVDECPF